MGDGRRPRTGHTGPPAAYRGEHHGTGERTTTTQIPDDTPDALASDDVDQIQDEELATPEETSRDFRPSGTDADPASSLNP